MKQIKNKLLSGLVILLWQCSIAQNHFWSQQYGATNTLMAGANIASIRDNAAIIYNPGVMGFIEQEKISLSANMYGFDIISLKNVAGNSVNARSVRSLIYPQFVGGCFVIKKIPKLKIFYGLATRNRNSTRFSVTHEMDYDVIKGAEGLEYYKGKLDYEFNSIESMAGLGVGYKLNDMFSVGVSMFGDYLNLESIENISINADAVFKDSLGKITPYTATVNENAALRIDHINLLWKLGFAANFKKLRLGLTITLPSARIWGRGNLQKSVEYYNLNIYATDSNRTFKNPSFLISNSDANLKAYYKVVPSFALGGSYVEEKYQLNLAMEFFMGTKPYNIISGSEQTYIRPVQAYKGETIKNFMTVTTGSKPVFNVAFGAAVKLKNKFKILTGFRTDFNNKMNFLPTNIGVNGSSLNASYWHLLHWSLGGSYNRGANDVTIGINYAMGIAADRAEVINFTEPEQSKWLRGNRERIMKTYVNNIGLIVGYTYFFRAGPKASEPAAKRIIEW